MSAGTITWFAHHELRLAWRDFLSMMTAGRRGRERTVVIALVLFTGFMHLVAWMMVARYAEVAHDPDKETLVAVTATVLLAFSLMLSQAMESTTRSFYARSDLDLILSSPVAARRIFSVRIAAMALSVAVMAMLLAAPFINVLAWNGGAQWLAAYGVVAAFGMVAAALAVAATVLLFRTIGPRRTRLAAQIIAAVIGAAFVIGLQVAAILSYGTISRTAILQSGAVIAVAPDVASIAWWPARAAMGDLNALIALAGIGVALIALAITIFSGRFAEHVIAAAGVAHAATRSRGSLGQFRTVSPMRRLRQKEWTLLARDPWLLSQTLMQLLYLIPPALLLWKSFADGIDALVLLVPVLVMAAGQLAGGLAWLAISGEDAPDLIATAPVATSQIVRAKIEAVMGAIALVFAPFIAALIIISPTQAIVAASGIVIATISATAIQLWFRAQARRSHFRRRQTSSRLATFAEAFVSISWAAAAGLAAAGTWFALTPAVFAVFVLTFAKAVAPKPA